MGINNRYPNSVKAGIPKLGVKPKGWTKTTYGKILHTIERPANINDNKKYTLVNAKRNRGGIVFRDNLYGKQIKTKTQFFIEKGDFLIAKRQIIHGACGLVPEELEGAIVSNEYSVLKEQDGLDIRYLEYFSHTLYFQQTCFQSSVGVDVEKMIFRLKDWLKYHLYLPPLAEQRKIADILFTWDNAIELTGRLIEAKRKRKRGLMQELLTGRKRLPGFDGEWREVRLGEVFQIKAGGDIDKNKFSSVKDELHQYPIYSNSLNNKGLYGYSSSYQYESGLITVTGRGTVGISNMRTERFVAIIRLLILIPKIELDTFYVSEYLNSDMPPKFGPIKV